jgi:hypothetical protein
MFIRNVGVRLQGYTVSQADVSKEAESHPVAGVHGQSNPDARRKVGRPRFGWLKDVENDVREMKLNRRRRIVHESRSKVKL